MSEFLDSLKSLHTALIDSREGYEEAVEEAEGKGLTPLFLEMIEMRTRHHQEIDQILRRSGEAPDESGSFMSTVHRTIIKVRSLFGGLDKSVLPGLIDGEKRIVEYYDQVLAQTPPALDTAVIFKQRQAIIGKITKMEKEAALAD